jgi:hypothetical protein
MSMYDIVLGDGQQEHRGALLLGLLGYPRVDRFRDAWVETSPDGPVIAVYTRQGGPNREGGAASNRQLTAHPLYLRDCDDRYEGTYATFYFSGPADCAEMLAELAVEPVDMAARWQEAITRIQSGKLRPAEIAAIDRLAAAVTDDSPGKSRIIRI